MMTKMTMMRTTRNNNPELFEQFKLNEKKPEDKKQNPPVRPSENSKDEEWKNPYADVAMWPDMAYEWMINI